MKLFTQSCILVLLLLFSSAYAQTADSQAPNQSPTTTSTASSAAVRSGILSEVTQRFVLQAAKWQDVLFSAARYIFWTLATISVVWTGVTLTFRRADAGEFVAELFKFSMFLGFFLWLFTNGPEFAISILKSLTMIGAKASGTTQLSPDDIVKIGFNVFGSTFSSFNVRDPVKSLALFLVAGVVLLLLLDTAITVILIQISGVLAVYAGIFILGFGGSRWTSDMAINYYKTILGTAVQLMVAILIVSVGINLLSSYRALLSQGDLTYEDITVLLIVAFILRSIVVKVPPMVAGMITSATGGGQIAAGSAAGVAAAAAAFGGGVIAGAKQTAGGGSAVIAAVKAAMADQATSGGDVVARMRESASLASAFPGRSGSGDAASSSRGSSSNSSSRPSSVDQVAGKSASDSSRVMADAPTKPIQGLSSSTDGGDSSSSSTQGGMPSAADSETSQLLGQASESSLSNSPASIASQASENSSFSLQDGPSSSNGGGNGSTPNEPTESSLQSSRDTMSSGPKPPAQSLSASTGPAKPWEVADGQVPAQDISHIAASPQSIPSPSALTNSDQSRQSNPVQREGDQSGQAGSDAPPRKFSTGRVTRVAMGAATHLASAGMSEFIKDTAGGKIAASIKGRQARREEDEKRALQNRNYIASAGPEFHAEVQELLNMNQKIGS